MIIQKLRIEKGWSQQQLAEMSGLSVRTIQRIENGKVASVESIKSLAAVFELDFALLQKELSMNNTHQTELKSELPLLSKQEKLAYQQVEKVKRFYYAFSVFVVGIIFLLIVNLLTSPNNLWVIWVFLGWGFGMIIKAIGTFMPFSLFSVEWEKRQLKKYLKEYKDK